MSTTTVRTENRLFVKAVDNISIWEMCNEILVASLIRGHPFIIKVRDVEWDWKFTGYDRTGWELEVKMDIGTPLSEMFDKWDVSETVINKWICQLLEALTDMEDAGIIHGDIKPDNIVIRNRCDLALIDFGHVTSNILRPKSVDTNFETQSIVDFARLNELTRGKNNMKHNNDISGAMFALGATIYCMVKQSTTEFDYSWELEKLCENPAKWLNENGVGESCRWRACILKLVGRQEDRPSSFGEIMSTLGIQRLQANHIVDTCKHPPYSLLSLNGCRDATIKLYTIGTKRCPYADIIWTALELFYIYIIPVCLYGKCKDPPTGGARIMSFALACLSVAGLGIVSFHTQQVNNFVSELLYTTKGQLPIPNLQWNYSTSFELLSNCLNPCESPIYGLVKLRIEDIDSFKLACKGLPDCPEQVVFCIGDTSDILKII